MPGLTKMNRNYPLVDKQTEKELRIASSQFDMLIGFARVACALDLVTLRSKVDFMLRLGPDINKEEYDKNRKVWEFADALLNGAYMIRTVTLEAQSNGLLERLTKPQS